MNYILKNSTKSMYSSLESKYPPLSVCRESILAAIHMLVSCYKSNNKILVCGNGGSAADAEHIVGELMKGFILPRPLSQNAKNALEEMWGDDGAHLHSLLQETIPAYSLVSQTSIMTAFANDQGADGVFAQQVYGYGTQGDVLIALSTSGNSQNVINAVKIAKYKKMTTLLFTGKNGGKLKELCDLSICVPSDITFEIQEYHLPIYHCLCAAVENELFGEHE